MLLSAAIFHLNILEPPGELGPNFQIVGREAIIQTFDGGNIVQYFKPRHERHKFNRVASTQRFTFALDKLAPELIRDNVRPNRSSCSYAPSLLSRPVIRRLREWMGSGRMAHLRKGL